MLTFNEELHEYRWNGIVIPSVTQIISGVGVRKNEHWNSLTGMEWMVDPTAALFGKAFHAIAEYLLRRIDCKYDEAMEPWVQSFKAFLMEHKHYIALTDQEGEELTERQMYSSRYQYCGTPDWPAMNPKDQTLWVFDWKTSVSYQKSFAWQTAAYAQLLKENFKIRKGIGTKTVLVSSSGYKIFTRKPSEVAQDFNKFSSINNVYRLAA